MILGTHDSQNVVLHPKQYVSCKATYLLKENFLSEFVTKSDKEQVLKNLGIDLDKKVVWGDIIGDIDDQEDLQIFLKKNEIDKLKYNNINFPNIENAKQALDKALNGNMLFVTDKEDLNSISGNPGMLCYVSEEDAYYKLNKDNKWVLLTLDSSNPDEITAEQVSYSNDTTSATNVKDALDELFNMIGDTGTTAIWRYTFTCNPSTMYYGTKGDVTFSYNITSGGDVKVTFEGITTSSKSGSVTVPDVVKPISKTLIAKSDTLGTLNKTISVNFAYKYFYYLSDSETFDETSTFKELTSGATIDCGDNEHYIYCIVRKESVIIKDPNFALEDSGAFSYQKDYVLPAETFTDQVSDVSGYKILRSSNPLSGKWTIKL